MNDELFLNQLQDADQVVVTPHALERGYDEEDIRERVTTLAGVIYWDTQEKAYHLVSDDLVIVCNVRNGKRIVVTAYPNSDPSRYQTKEYRILRG
jgi:hypothetical protein